MDSFGRRGEGGCVSDAPEPGNFRALIPLYNRAYVAWWFARSGWAALALPGGNYLVRRGPDELVVSTSRRFEQRVEIRGILADGAAMWPELCRLLGDAGGHYQAWWTRTSGVECGAVIGETMALGTDPRNVAPTSWVPQLVNHGSPTEAEPGAAPDPAN
jgi:hypothetical protein